MPTIPIIDPQPARGRFREALWDDPDWWAEHKLHGCRYLLYSDGRLLSRHASVKGTGYVDKIDRTPQFAEAAKLLPSGTVLDGEVVLHTFGTVRDVTSILGSLPEEAIAKQRERGFLHFRAFDMPFYNGQDWRFGHLYARREKLEQTIAFVSGVPYVSLLPKVHLEKKKFCDDIMAQGGEGVILKWRYATYGQQSKWVKVKRSETFDVFVIGFKEATEMSTKVDGAFSPTRFAERGWIGAIEMGMKLRNEFSLDDAFNSPYDDVSVGFVSGFDEETRAFISANREALLGTCMEIEAQSQLPSGKFEHPRFVRFRDDKGKEDCIWTPG